MIIFYVADVRPVVGSFLTLYVHQLHPVLRGVMTFESFINGQDCSFFEVGKINEQPHYLNSIEGMYLQTLNTLQP